MNTGVSEGHAVSIFRVEGFCLNLSLPCYEDHNTNLLVLSLDFSLTINPYAVGSAIDVFPCPFSASSPLEFDVDAAWFISFPCDLSGDPISC